MLPDTYALMYDTLSRVAGGVPRSVDGVEVRW